MKFIIDKRIQIYYTVATKGGDCMTKKTRSVTLRFRCAPELAEQLRITSEENNIIMSDFIRVTLTQALKTGVKIPKMLAPKEQSLTTSQMMNNWGTFGAENKNAPGFPRAFCTKATVSGFRLFVSIVITNERCYNRDCQVRLSALSLRNFSW